MTINYDKIYELQTSILDLFKTQKWEIQNNTGSDKQILQLNASNYSIEISVNYFPKEDPCYQLILRKGGQAWKIFPEEEFWTEDFCKAVKEKIHACAQENRYSQLEEKYTIIANEIKSF